MRLRIHRGTKEIGGTCIQVEAGGKRLVLDVGLPLDAPDEAQETPFRPHRANLHAPLNVLLPTIMSRCHSMLTSILPRFIKVFVPKVLPIQCLPMKVNVDARSHVLLRRIDPKYRIRQCLQNHVSTPHF